MFSEIELLHSCMTDEKAQIISGLEFLSGSICGKNVVLCCSEIGKVNAAMCAQTLALYFNADRIINTGVAGCTCDDLGVLDMVISKELVFHDYDWHLLEKYHPRTSCFAADPSLITLAQTALEQRKNLSFKYKLGRIATGDIFVNDDALRRSIIERTRADCVEMEGAAIAMVSFSNGIPFLAVRTMSDNANHESDAAFNDFERAAAENSARLILDMLRLS